MPRINKPGANPIPLTTRNEEVTETGVTLEAQSDEFLLERVAASNREALALLFHRHASNVRNVVRCILGHEEDDLVQDVFVFLSRKAALFKATHGAARSWIMQVTYHRAFNRRSYLKTRRFYTSVDLEQVMLTSAQCQSEAYFVEWCLKGVWSEESAARLRQLLSPAQLVTIELHFFEGYTLEQAAHRLGQTLGNVRHHYYRGLEKLREASARWKAAIQVSRTVDVDSNREVPIIGSDHVDDYFIELCALSSTGTLSIAEWHQFETHLSHCASCRAIKAEYEKVVSTTLPAMASNRANTDDGNLADPIYLREAQEALFERINRQNSEP